MPRKLSNFNGKCVLLCGGWISEHRAYKPYTITKDNFYTVDIDPSTKPDAVFDITHREHWQQFQDSSVDFIFFESTLFLENMEIAFKECLRVLSENGVVFYRGGSRFLPAQYVSISNIFQTAGFKQTLSGKPYFDQGKFQYDKGSYTLASKSQYILTQEFLNKNLSEEALNVIKSVNFFSHETVGFHSFFRAGEPGNKGMFERMNQLASSFRPSTKDRDVCRKLDLKSF